MRSNLVVHLVRVTQYRHMLVASWTEQLSSGTSATAVYTASESVFTRRCCLARLISESTVSRWQRRRQVRVNTAQKVCHRSRLSWVGAEHTMPAAGSWLHVMKKVPLVKAGVAVRYLLGT